MNVAARRYLWLVAALGLMLLWGIGGCEALESVTGKGFAKPRYEFPKAARVLVMVDPRPGGLVPVDVPPALGQAITEQLFAHQKEKNEFVAQSRLALLRSDPDKFRQMSVSDVAKATNADYVLFVDLLQFQVIANNDSEITEGACEALVKVVSREGTRLFPTDDSTGVSVQATLEPTLGEKPATNQSKDEMVGLLSVRIARLFFKYDLEDKDLAK